MLRRKGLKVSGRKEELVQRLFEADAESKEEAEAELEASQKMEVMEDVAIFEPVENKSKTVSFSEIFERAAAVAGAFGGAASRIAEDSMTLTAKTASDILDDIITPPQ